MSNFVKAEVVRRINEELNRRTHRVAELEAEVKNLRAENEKLKGAQANDSNLEGDKVATTATSSKKSKAKAKDEPLVTEPTQD